MFRLGFEPDEQSLRRLIPAADIPCRVETVDRPAERLRKCDHGRRSRASTLAPRIFGIAAAGKFEQIGAFSPAEAQRARKA